MTIYKGETGLLVNAENKLLSNCSCLECPEEMPQYITLTFTGVSADPSYCQRFYQGEEWDDRPYDAKYKSGGIFNGTFVLGRVSRCVWRYEYSNSNLVLKTYRFSPFSACGTSSQLSDMPAAYGRVTASIVDNATYGPQFGVAHIFARTALGQFDGTGFATSCFYGEVAYIGEDCEIPSTMLAAIPPTPAGYALGTGGQVGISLS